MNLPDQRPDNDDATLAKAGAPVNRWDALLNQCPVSDIQGVVHPSGAGEGVSTAGGAHGDWTFTLTLKPWKKAGGEYQDTELVVRKEVSKWELRLLKDRFSAHNVVHLKLRVLEGHPMEKAANRGDAQLVEIVTTRFEDEELEKQARELAKPRFYLDDYFGELKLDRRTNRLVTTRWRGRSRYTVQIARDRETYDARLAWEKIQFIESRLPAIREAIADHLFEDYDSGWESLGALTRARFAKRPKLQSVIVGSDGRSNILFNDGGLFHGQEIGVSIDANHRIDSAYLED